MSKDKISDYSSTANSNTDIAAINIDEGCAPSGINNAIRALMAQLKNFQTGASGDSFNGPINGTVGATTPAAGTFTSLSDSGNLTFTGTGNRITGDFSNATVANRVTFQTSTSNAATGVQATPSGTGTASLFLAANASDPTNASWTAVYTNASESMIQASRFGTGTYLPMTFYTGGSERMRVDTSGNVGIGTTTAAAGGLLTLNKAPAAAFGSPIFQLGGASFTSGGYYSIGMGFTDATYTEPPAEIAYVAASDSGGTKGAIVFGNRDVTTNTAVTERARIDSSGNVGIGTSSPAYKVDINTSTVPLTDTFSSLQLRADSYGYVLTGGIKQGSGGILKISMNQANTVSEVARFDSSGNFLVSKTADTDSVAGTVITLVDAGGAGKHGKIKVTNTVGTGQYVLQCLNASGSTVGGVTSSSTATAFPTSSDYRLKENIAPMTGALEKVASLKPVTYTWKANGEATHGFIAHELQEVVPECVTGEKDAVETYTDEEGNEQTRPVYQGIDTSFLVATLTAAIQEQQAIITQLQADVAALKGN